MRDGQRVFLLRASNPNDLDRICAFLNDVHVRVRDKRNGTIMVSTPGAASLLHEEREIIGYATTWNALNPRSRVELGQPD